MTAQVRFYTFDGSRCQFFHGPRENTSRIRLTVHPSSELCTVPRPKKRVKRAHPSLGSFPASDHELLLAFRPGMEYNSSIVVCVGSLGQVNTGANGFDRIADG